MDGPDDTVAVAAAPLAGRIATADAFEDRIEVRDIRGTLVRAVTRADIQALVPWMSLDGGPDGPSGLTFSSTGRLLFILVHDDTIPGDGLGSDAVLRLDVSTGGLTLFSRRDLFDRGDIPPRLCAAHVRGVLYVGTGSGTVLAYSATANALNGTPAATWSIPGGGVVHGLCVDRDNGAANAVYVATATGVYRANMPGSVASAPVFTQIVSAPGGDIRAIAWGDHFGGAAQRGLYILSGDTGVGSKIEFINAASAQGAGLVAPAPYLTTPDTWNDLTFCADGSLLAAADEDAVRITDSADTRLDFDSFVADEFAQVTGFCRGLISPDGEPAGWVIDGDVIPAWNRFHPATPDGAAWTVLTLLMHDYLHNDPAAQSQVRSVLIRYAGLHPDGIKPVRSADGIFKHWLDPLTGNTKATWTDEYATLSTMKIVVAAARAMQFYPDDAGIVRAASRIIFRTRNWEAYLRTGTLQNPGDDALAFTGMASGGPTNSWSLPFHEGIIFAEQAGVYGGDLAKASATRWFSRSGKPTATWVNGQTITSGASGVFQPAFLSMYPALLSAPFRADLTTGGWRAQVENVRWAHCAWTDDNTARYSTVFSAGDNGNGYNADSLSGHPGDQTTFTSLMALSAYGDTAEAVGAYAAYRKGARQTFKLGYSILYRRPVQTTVTTVPNTAGLPDVALGALGLAELLQPGAVDAVLARPYPTIEMCPADMNADGVINEEDLHRLAAAPTDINGDGLANAGDVACLMNWLRRHEPGSMSGR